MSSCDCWKKYGKECRCTDLDNTIGCVIGVGILVAAIAIVMRGCYIEPPTTTEPPARIEEVTLIKT